MFFCLKTHADLADLSRIKHLLDQQNLHEPKIIKSA